MSFATVNWIDVFTRKIYFDIVVDSLRYCIEHKGMELYAWVIMPSHVHLIISSGDKNLSDIMRDLKRHTSKTLLKTISENVQESRREWLLWIACPDFSGFAEQGSEIPTMKFTNFGSKTTILLS